MIINSDKKKIFFRLYLTIGFVVFSISNLFSWLTLIDAVSAYKRQSRTYDSIYTKETKTREFCKTCTSRIKVFDCSKKLPRYLTDTILECHYECCSDAIYNKHTGEISTEKDGWSNVTFKELSKPHFDFSSLYFALTTLILLPAFFILLKKWFVWAFNIHD